MKNEFTGKVVLITGSSQGIGKAIAEEFAKAGAKIILCSRTKKDLEKAKSEITPNDLCDIFAADVSKSEEVKKLFDFISEKHKRLDVLVNCAGVYGPIGPLEKNSQEKWEQAIKINLIGTMSCCRLAIPFMKKQGSGKIINLAGAGVGGNKIKPNLSSYVSSKFAVAGFTEALANELKESNIQVNAISPGAVNTRMLDEVLAVGKLAGEEFLNVSERQKKEGGTPPEKAAKLALFLAGKESDFVTGKLISAVWDDYSNFGKIRTKLEKSSLYALRRVDDFLFFEKNK